MVDTEVQTRLIEQLERLPLSKQQRVLDYARSLAEPLRGTPGEDFLELCGTLSRESAEEMTRAIEEGCEQIDLDDWK
jgi:hypothetical protein